jgi:UDP-glucuronate 4-epimerase
MDHALVTGVSGFIGSHLAADLLDQGWTVTGLDRRSPVSDPVAAENLACLAGRDRFHLVVADLNQADLSVLAEDAQVVFHLAALPGVRRSWGDAFGDYVHANILATQRILEACAMAEGPRLVLASSSSVYGPGTGHASRESDPLAPVSPYGVTKLTAERLALAYAARPHAATSVIALRYFTVYGPRQRPDMAISRMMRAAMSGTTVPLYGSGEQRRDFTFIADVVAATIAAATAVAQAEVVNVGSGSSVSIAEVVDTIAGLSGTPVQVLRQVAQPGDVEATAADLTRASAVLGYSPRVTLTEGVAAQWAWLSARRVGGSRPELAGKAAR